MIISLAQLPPILSAYLTATGSLTALLEQKAGKPLRVEVLSQQTISLNHAQKTTLNLPKNHPQLAIARTVLLYGDNEAAWIQATSIFPFSSLTGTLKRLKYLGNTPIGYVLFKKYRTLPHTRHYYQNQLGQFGRQTIYYYQQKPLLIDELFLEGFLSDF